MAERYRPWHPITVNRTNDPVATVREIRKCDAVAIHAFANGIADEQQQKRAWNAIMHICGVNDMAWMPEEHGGDRDTSFAAGKQFVAFQLRKIATVSLSILTGEANDRPEHDRRTGKPADGRNSDRARQ